MTRHGLDACASIFTRRSATEPVDAIRYVKEPAAKQSSDVSGETGGAAAGIAATMSRITILWR